MNQDMAIENFAALAQDSRLAIFRLLVQQGTDGLPAGAISRRLNMVPSTLSGHLGILKRAGLLTAARHSREIRYAANLDHMGDLIRFMFKDCCAGRIEDCEDILSLI